MMTYFPVVALHNMTFHLLTSHSLSMDDSYVQPHQRSVELVCVILSHFHMLTLSSGLSPSQGVCCEACLLTRHPAMCIYAYLYCGLPRAQSTWPWPRFNSSPTSGGRTCFVSSVNYSPFSPVCVSAFIYTLCLVFSLTSYKIVHIFPTQQDTTFAPR